MLDVSGNRKHSFSRFLYNELIPDTNKNIHELPDSDFKNIRTDVSEKLNDGMRTGERLTT
ncbi:MAG: hypothetical protein P1U74_07755 [Legionellaceae bacterium]|nr:hypothetical protein [Legionellaceae bacterium]